MYGCESWTIKKAECQRIDAFELRCWSGLLRVPWTARRSNQSILKEISPEYSLEGLMLKLKLQYFGHLMQRADSFEKTLMLEKIVGGRRRGQPKMRWLDGITDSMDMSLSQAPGVGDGQGGLACCSPWSRKESDRTERLNWTEEQRGACDLMGTSESIQGSGQHCLEVAGARGALAPWSPESGGPGVSRPRAGPEGCALRRPRSWRREGPGWGQCAQPQAQAALWRRCLCRGPPWAFPCPCGGAGASAARPGAGSVL